MAKNTWHVVVEDGAHTVVAEHGYFTGRIKISVDGQVVLKQNLYSVRFKKRTPGDLSSQHHFNLSGHDAALYIKSPDGFRYVYDLLLDGRSVTTGEVFATQPQVRAPGWAWLFAAASFVAFLAGYFLPPWLLDAHPTTTFIWYGVAIVAVMRCLRIGANPTMPDREKITKSSIVVAVTLVLSAVVTGGSVLLTQSYWHTASSTSGAYSVSVPCGSKEETTDYGVEMSCYDANMRYGAWYENLSNATQSLGTDELLADYMESVQHPRSGAKVELVDDRPVTLQTYAGREYTAILRKTTIESRIYIVDNRAYHLTVAADNKSFNRAQAGKFLDSFHLTPVLHNSQ